MTLSSSTLRIQWKCHVCNNEWSSKLNQSVYGAGCPNCRKKEQRIRRSTPSKGESLQDVFPEVAKEWDYNKNEKSPADFFPRSRHTHPKDEPSAPK